MMNRIIKKGFAFGLAIALLICAAGVSAQTGQTKNLRFAKVASSTVVSGAVVWGTRNRYLVEAKAGQTMTVIIHSKREEGGAVFQIYRPGANAKTLPGTGETDDATRWEGRLPATGVYTISVGPSWGNATYSLKVAIR